MVKVKTLRATFRQFGETLHASGGHAVHMMRTPRFSVQKKWNKRMLENYCLNSYFDKI